MNPLPKRWILPAPLSAQSEEVLSIYPSGFRRVLHNRGITTLDAAREYLNPQPPAFPPEMHASMEDAVQRILFSIDQGEWIAVYGDYDVDGVTATALMVELLTRFGARVHWHIPNRFEEGYGLNCDALSELASAGVRLVITVDCGIRSLVEAQHARSLGMDMIISDHHQPGEELPAAIALINPHLPGNPYPDKDLAGVGLAYHLASALLHARPIPGIQATDWLDLVALGTIADLAPLRGENRYLVRQGLAQLRRSRRQGIVSLAGAAGLKLPSLTSRDVAFMLAPRLNAAGRIDTATDALNLLLETDFMRSGPLAQRLDSQNRDRQDRTHKAQEAALQLSAESPFDPMQFAFSEDFNSGIVGLVASRLVDSRYRPAIVGQIEGDLIRASCRSIPEFHITHALDQCADLFVRHGGHAMAAGLTLATARLEEFQTRLAEIATQELSGKELIPQLRADAELDLSTLNQHDLRDMLLLLDQIQPTGQDNQEVAFVSRSLRVVRARAVGANQKHLKLTVASGRTVWDAIAFSQGHWAQDMPAEIDLLYGIEENEFNGRVSMQLNVRDIHGPDQADLIRTAPSQS